jgi:hypothetical protein
MSDPINLLGDVAGIMVQVNGRWWTLSPIGPAIRARFVAWCKARARQEIISQRHIVSEDGYNDAHNCLTEASTAGAYKWNSPDPRRMGRAIRAILSGEDGQVQLLTLLLAAHHPDTSFDEVMEILQSESEGIQYALASAMGTLAPNAPRPAGMKPATEENMKLAMDGRLTVGPTVSPTA